MATASLGKYNSFYKKMSWLLLLGAIGNHDLSSAWAQSNKIAINQNNMNQPLTIRGTSGGAIAAWEIAQTKNTPTGYCDGFARSQPNHIFKIDTFFDRLRLEVESSTDTTILVKGAGGVWCNDDAGSANPVIEGQWQPGVYRVWVGSYRADSSNSYKIKITGKPQNDLGN